MHLIYTLEARTRAMSDRPQELEERVRELSNAVNAVTLSDADRATLRALVSALDETLQQTKAYWDELHQDLIDNQTSHFLQTDRFRSNTPFE